MAQSATQDNALENGEYREPLIDFAELINDAHQFAPPPEWLVDQWIPRRGVVNFSGHGESGKTYLGLDLILAALQGKKWLGLDTKEINSACFLTAEQSRMDINHRLDILLGKYGYPANGETPRLRFFKDYLEPAGKRFLYQSTRSGDMVTPFWQWIGSDYGPTRLWLDIQEWLQQEDCEIFIIDSILHFFHEPIVEKGKVLYILNDLSRFSEATGCLVAFLYHPTLTGLTGTGAVEGLGGALEWHNQVDTRLLLRYDKEEDTRQLAQMKSRHGPAQKDVDLKWIGAGFGPLDRSDQPNGFDVAQRIIADCNKQKLILSPNTTARSYYPKIMWSHELNRDGKKRLITAKTKDEQILCWVNLVRELMEQGKVEITELMNSSRHSYQGLTLTAKSEYYV